MAGIYADGTMSILTDLQVITNRVGLQVNAGSVLTRCLAMANVGEYAIAANRSLVEQCTAIGNSGDGFLGDIGCMFNRCTAQDNGSDGFWITHDCLVQSCLSRNNVSHGIYVSGSDNRLDGNVFHINNKGIYVAGYSDNIITRNSASGNTTDYDIPGGNLVGAIVTSSLVGATAWDNFSH